MSTTLSLLRGPAAPPTRSRLVNTLIASGCVAVGTVAGAAVGVVARVWMRLITDEPEFTWSGTIFIIVAFALHGMGTTAAAIARDRSRRRWLVRTARTAGGVLSLGLFAGAGAAMLPTVLAASLATHRTDWPRAGRAVAALVAVPLPVLIVAAEAGRVGEPDLLAGYALMAVTYAAIVWALRPVVAPAGDGRRLHTLTRVFTAVVAVVALALMSLLAVAVATGS